MKSKNTIITILISLLGITLALPAKAICPVCTVAVGFGVGFSRWLGIDDSISGLWIGALTVSMIMWTNNWLDKKNYWKFKSRNFLMTVAYYLLIVVPLFFTGIMGHPLNKIWGIDKLLLGIIFGSIAFFVANFWYEFLKKKNNNHAYFPYQKVAMPVGVLILFSLLFYFLTK